jgi:hypothetical protein
MASDAARMPRCRARARTSAARGVRALEPGAQELLGHCAALYQANRRGAAELVAHLERYGYQAPPGARPEPEDPCAAAGGGAARSGSEEFCLEDGAARRGGGARLEGEARPRRHARGKGERPAAAGSAMRRSPAAAGPSPRTPRARARADDAGSGPMLMDQGPDDEDGLRGASFAGSTASSPGAGRSRRHAPPATRSLPSSPVSAVRSGLTDAVADGKWLCLSYAACINVSHLALCVTGRRCLLASWRRATSQAGSAWGSRAARCAAATPQRRRQPRRQRLASGAPQQVQGG